jgi:hypothetical protein
MEWALATSWPGPSTTGADLAEGTKRSPTTDISCVDGRVKTLREVADHLRAGDYLPGGRLHDEAVAG